MTQEEPVLPAWGANQRNCVEFQKNEAEDGAAATHTLQGRRSTSKTEGEIVKVKRDELEPGGWGEGWELTRGEGQDCPEDGDDDEGQPLSLGSCASCVSRCGASRRP